MNETELQIIEIDDSKYKTLVTKNFLRRKKYVPNDPAKLIAFIPGTIREIVVKVGDNVKKDDVLLILEAMKMKNQIKSQFNAKIKSISVKSGDIVMKNQLLLEFELS